MNPRFPIFIPSKHRMKNHKTMRSLDRMGVPYRVIVEADQLDGYAETIPRDRLIVLDPKYIDEYDSCDPEGDSKGMPKGAGPARNLAWDISTEEGHEFHWVMDDNIRLFGRLNQNEKVSVGVGTMFYVMEEFVLRYSNVAMAGPQYDYFTPRRAAKKDPFALNTRIYSCNLIRNDIPFRWRARLNEDTTLSLDVLKAGWCTILFNGFLQYKIPTMIVKGGNADEFYTKEPQRLSGTQILKRVHPDVTTIVRRFGRWHHQVDYRRFRSTKLRRRSDLAIQDGEDEHGMKLIRL